MPRQFHIRWKGWQMGVSHQRLRSLVERVRSAALHKGDSLDVPIGIDGDLYHHCPLPPESPRHLRIGTMRQQPPADAGEPGRVGMRRHLLLRRSW